MKRRVISSVSDLKKYKCKNRQLRKRLSDKHVKKLKRMIRQWRKAMAYTVSTTVTALKKTKIGTITTCVFGAFGISEVDADALLEEIVHNSLGDLK